MGHTMARVTVVGESRVEFANHLVLDVRWMLRVHELFVFRGAHVSVEWEMLEVVWRGFFRLGWRQVWDARRGEWRWSWAPRLQVLGVTG